MRIETREAQMEDLGVILAAAEMAHAEAPHYDDSLPFSRAHVANNVAQTINSPHGAVILALVDGEIVGGIVAMIARYYTVPNLFSFDEFFWVTPEHRGKKISKLLVEHFILWSTQQGVTKMHIGHTSGLDSKAFEVLMEAYGFEKLGETFRR